MNIMPILIGIIKNYTSADFLYDLVLIGTAYCYVLITILIPVYLKKRGMISKFIARKIVHLFTGLIVLIVPFFILPLHALVIAASLTVLVYFSSKDSRVKQLQELYESIGEEAEERVGRLQGPFHYCISITLLLGIFVAFAPDQLYFPICGILIMIVSDSLAAIIGKKYGRIKINISFSKSQRTLEGSLAFFVSAFILCFSAFYFFGLLNPINQKMLTLNLIVAYSFITAFLGTVVELVSPSTWDDLTVPIATTIIIFLLTLIT